MSELTLNMDRDVCRVDIQNNGYRGDLAAVYGKTNATSPDAFWDTQDGANMMTSDAQPINCAAAVCYTCYCEAMVSSICIINTSSFAL